MDGAPEKTSQNRAPLDPTTLGCMGLIVGIIGYMAFIGADYDRCPISGLDSDQFEERPKKSKPLAGRKLPVKVRPANGVRYV